MACLCHGRRQPRQPLCRTDASDGSPKLARAKQPRERCGRACSYCCLSSPPRARRRLGDALDMEHPAPRRRRPGRHGASIQARRRTSAAAAVASAWTSSAKRLRKAGMRRRQARAAGLDRWYKVKCSRRNETWSKLDAFLAKGDAEPRRRRVRRARARGQDVAVGAKRPAFLVAEPLLLDRVELRGSLRATSRGRPGHRLGPRPGPRRCTDEHLAQRG